MRFPFRSVLISALASGLAILLAFATGPTAQAQSPQDEKTSPSPAAQSGTQSAERGAQIQPGTSRPKIGIALEGGGALGLAHIGVLQWFEDHHIPIDYVAGTSMGGLVGGLYARTTQGNRRCAKVGHHHRR
jgi:NTE family protein